MFRALSVSIIRSINNCRSVATALSAVATDLGHPYWIYIIPTHGINQWLLLLLLILLMMETESARNM